MLDLHLVLVALQGRFTISMVSNIHDGICSLIHEE